jgi:hypothetical protein
MAAGMDGGVAALSGAGVGVGVPVIAGVTAAIGRAEGWMVGRDAGTLGAVAPAAAASGGGVDSLVAWSPAQPIQATHSRTANARHEDSDVTRILNLQPARNLIGVKHLI